MLKRTLEPEFNDDDVETQLYDAMDHAAINRQFVDDLLAGGAVGPDMMDLGTGTGLVVIELCRRADGIRVMAVDASISMLEQAKINIDVAALRDRIQLEHDDAKRLEAFEDGMFDLVMSNSLLHHLPQPRLALEQAIRLTKAGGRIFHRDLLRPESEAAVEALVAQHAATEPAASQQLLRQSLHAALSLEEIRELAVAIGLPAASVQVTSDRHWTLDSRIGG